MKELKSIGVSIIVCCYNSEKLLPETIKYIANQKVDSNTPWELIVVNNNSNDNTSEVARIEWSKYNCRAPFKIIDEPKAGLINARNKGIYNAKFEYIIFCDDDNWLQEDYVQISYNIMNNNNMIGVLAGQGRAVANIEIPTWFYSNYSRYACGVLDMESGDVTDKRNWVWGAGMVIRASIYKKIISAGFVSMTTGRKGSDLASGDDVEICCWFKIVGYKLWYDERLKFLHFMSDKRLDKEMAKKQFQAQIKSASVTQIYNTYIKCQTINRNLWSLVMATINLTRMNFNNFNVLLWYSKVFNLNKSYNMIKKNTKVFLKS